MWVLRAYGASVTQSGQRWGGFGNGILQTGVDANGAGVSVQYLTTCAEALGPLPTSPSSPTGPPHGSSTTSPSSPFADLSFPFDTSATHKSLAPISLALLLPTVIFNRLSSPPTSGPPIQLSFGLRCAAVLMLIVAYGAGLAGLVSSFTSITASGSGSLSRRATSSNTLLKTTHGKAGLALFIALYGLFPLLFFVRFLRWRMSASPREIVGKIRAERSRADSSDTAEKLNSYRAASDTNQPGAVPTSPPVSPPGSTPSRRHLRLWFRSREGRTSSDTASESESTVPPTFEVVNRPARTRHPSAGGTPTLYDHAHRPSTTPRNLSDLSWLDRRRSVNAVVRIEANHWGRLAELERFRVI